MIKKELEELLSGLFDSTTNTDEDFEYATDKLAQYIQYKIEEAEKRGAEAIAKEFKKFAVKTIEIINKGKEQ